MNESKEALAARYEAWLKSRPKHVREFADLHPFAPGEQFEFNGEKVFFVGYSENIDTGEIGLLITETNPFRDSVRAMAEMRAVFGIQRYN